MLYYYISKYKNFRLKQLTRYVLITLGVAEKELHPNHQFLIDIRGRLIPNMCSNLHTNHSQSDILKKKQQLCEQQLLVMDIIDPGLSVARGKLLIELQQCILQLGMQTFYYFHQMRKHKR